MEKSTSSDHQNPPRIPQRFLRWYCKPELVEDIEGDIHEDFIKRYARLGKNRARLYYTLDVIRFFRPFAVKSLIKKQTPFPMLGSFFTLAIRNIRRDVYGTLLYFLLLVVGISSFAVILSIYKNEMSFDDFLKDGDRIYRTSTFFKRGDQDVRWANTSGVIAQALKEGLPEIEASTQLLSIADELIIDTGEKSLQVPRMSGFYTDPDLFEVLSYPLLYGDPKHVLTEPNSIVLSKKLAMRLFDNTDIVGKTLQIEGLNSNSSIIKVTGILEDIPYNSLYQFDLLISGSTLTRWSDFAKTRSGFPMQVLFKAIDIIEDEPGLEQKIQEKAKLIYGPRLTMEFPIQPFRDIHLYSEFPPHEMERSGNLLFTRILLAVGFVILSIAAINFSILYTAKSLVRAKEIGIRKTLGSSNFGIGLRLMAESCLLSVLCTLVALAYTELLLSSVVHKHLYDASLSVFDSPKLIMIILSAGLILGLVSGAYVTSRAARFNTTQILKGKFKAGRAAFLGGRNLLVIFQFVLTSTLITASLMFLKQLNYIKDKDLGYEKEAVISVAKPSNMSAGQFEIFRQSLGNESAVISSGYILYDFLDGYNSGSLGVEHEGDTLWVQGQMNMIDHGIVSTLGLEIVEGRNFSESMVNDSEGVIINETAKKMLGIGDVVGKKYTRGREIIGVVKDFHFESFINKIPPLFLYNKKNYFQENIMIRIATQSPRQVIERLDQKWQAAGASIPFEPKFLESSFLRLLEKEARLSKIITTYTVISIIVACLGLFGLVSYTNEQRKKEVGIRKVYGASLATIMKLINGYFFRLTFIALLVAIPVSYFGINQWLNTFAYHTQQGMVEYLLSGLILVAFAFIITSLRTVKIARSNPVDVLKEE